MKHPEQRVERGTGQRGGRVEVNIRAEYERDFTNEGIANNPRPQHR